MPRAFPGSLSRKERIMRKSLFVVLFAVFALAAVSPAPADACSPNPALMQQTCYSSCANYAEYLYFQEASTCGQNYCVDEFGQPATCSPGYYVCMGNANQNKCNSLRDCEDYCHEW